MASSIRGFDLAIRDINGDITMLLNHTLDILVDDVPTYTVDSNSEGYVPDTEISEDADTEVDIKSPSYPEIFTQITKSKPSEVYIDRVTFLAEDLLTDTSPADRADLWLLDESLPDINPIKLMDNVKSDSTYKFPYESAKVSKNLKIALISKTKDGKPSDDNFLTTENTDIAIDPIVPEFEVQLEVDVTPIVGGATEELLFIDEGILASSPKVTFNGTLLQITGDIEVAAATLATVGTPVVNSPYLTLVNSGWDVSEAEARDSGIRMLAVPLDQAGQTYISSNLVFEFKAHRADGYQIWNKAFEYGNFDTSYLYTRLNLKNPISGTAHGGYLKVYYDGTFSFHDASDNLSPLAAESFGANTSGSYNNYFMNGSYSPIIAPHFGGKLLLASGIPAHLPSAGAGYDANCFVQSDMWFGIGTTIKPLAMLEVKNRIADADIKAILKHKDGSATGDFLQVRESDNTILLKIDKDGHLTTQDIIVSDGKNFIFNTTTGTKIGTSTSQKFAFWDATPVVQATVTGSDGGNGALQSLIGILETYGLIVDNTTTPE